jgi:hypothetical protein
MSVPNFRSQRPAVAPVNPRGRQLIIAVVVLVVIVLLVKLLGPHENKYEKLAGSVTVALQNNDLDAVRKLQNAETATDINRGIVGRAADVLAPLGKLKSVKEVTPPDAPERTHEFTVTFDRGAVRERMKVDPDFKIVRFQYEKIAQ